TWARSDARFSADSSPARVGSRASSSRPSPMFEISAASAKLFHAVGRATLKDSEEDLELTCLPGSRLVGVFNTPRHRQSVPGASNVASQVDTTRCRASEPLNLTGVPRSDRLPRQGNRSRPTVESRGARPIAATGAV